MNRKLIIPFLSVKKYCQIIAVLLLFVSNTHAISWEDRGGEAIRLGVLGERLPLWLSLPYIDSYAQIQTQSCLTLKKICGV